MKKFYIPYIVFCFFLITLFITNIQFKQNNTLKSYESKTTNTHTTNKTSEKKDTIKDYYVVKTDKESIFLYDNNNTQLNKLDIDYKNLRQFDKDQFNKGIVVSDMSEVYQLIEDFSN